MLGAAVAVSKWRRAQRALDLGGHVALVTGGSRGLGLLIARELGRQGAVVMLVARDEMELRRAQQDLHARGVEAAYVVADITDEATAERIVSETITRFGRLDVLINNAGVITVGPIDHMSVTDFADAMSTHFWGPLHAMRAAIPFMKQRGGGRIVNISSIGGRVGVPHLTAYCASKFALTGLSTSLQAELRQHGIFVTTVCPGLMRTGSPFNARFKGRHREEFAWFTIADSLPVISIDGRRAAVQVVDAMRHGDAELIVSWPARVAIAAAAVAPNTVATAMDLTNRLMPSANGEGEGRSYSGWQSTSRWAPSALTRLSERSAAANNELPSV